MVSRSGELLWGHKSQVSFYGSAKSCTSPRGELLWDVQHTAHRLEVSFRGRARLIHSPKGRESVSGELLWEEKIPEVSLHGIVATRLSRERVSGEGLWESAPHTASPEHISAGSPGGPFRQSQPFW